MTQKRKFSKLSITALVMTIIVVIQYFFPFVLYFQESIDPYALGNGFNLLLANLTFYLNMLLLISILIISILSLIFIKKYKLRGIWISIICLVYGLLYLLSILLFMWLASGLS